jgi:hypothetical protein
MSEILADPPDPSVITCFPDPESGNVNGLSLIPRRVARAMRTGASRREAPATRGAGRAAFPIRGDACPISSPGR